MIHRFLKYINQNKLFKPSDKLLITVSGGLDSVVLAHLFYEAKFEFAIAHCNFQLRGNDSNLDELFVFQLAEKYGVEFFSVKFETEKYQIEKGISVQMAARELRYEWFNEIKSKNQFDYIVTAHHANDQLETVLFNLSKGTGLRGIRGIKPKNEFLIRPLLFATRDEILAYANDYNLQWREDCSNSSTKYKRNALRHLVVPELKKINPSIENAVFQFTENMQQLEFLLKSQVEFWRNKIVKTENKVTYIDLIQLEDLDYKSLMLFELLSEFGFQNVNEIVEASLSFSGKNFYSENYHLVVDRAQLVIVEIENKDFEELEIEIKNSTYITKFGKFEVEILDNFSLNQIQKMNNIAYIDLSKINGKLLLRTWKQGDTIKPLGMKGKSQKVSDILINEKVPVNLKSKILILENEDQIVWLAGYKMSEEFKLKNDINKVLKVSLIAY